MKLLGDYEQLILLQMIMVRPGIYLLELQKKLFMKFGMLVSVLRFMDVLGRVCIM